MAGSVLVIPGRTDGQVEAWLPWFRDGDGGVECRGLRCVFVLSDGHVEVCWPQRSPGTEAGQCVDALPPLTLLLQSPLLGHNGLVVRQLPPRLRCSQLAEHLHEREEVNRRNKVLTTTDRLGG